MGEDVLAINEVSIPQNPSGKRVRHSNSAKQRITFYASQMILDIINRMKCERGDDSITDAVCQIISEYGSLKTMSAIEQTVDERFSRTHAVILSLKAQNEALRDRLSLVEAKCASVNREVSEMRAVCFTCGYESGGEKTGDL